jgi:hypothetical protein
LKLYVESFVNEVLRPSNSDLPREAKIGYLDAAESAVCEYGYIDPGCAAYYMGYFDFKRSKYCSGLFDRIRDRLDLPKKEKTVDVSRAA